MWRMPLLLAGLGCASRDRNVLHLKVSQKRFTGERVFAWAGRMEVGGLKGLAKQVIAGCTINDLLVSCVVVAALSLSEEQQSNKPNKLTVNIPVDLKRRQQTSFEIENDWV